MGLGIALLSLGAASAQTTSAVVPLAPTPNPPPCNSYILQNAASLGIEQRLCLYRDSLLTPSGLFGDFFFSGIDQARRTPEEWGVGWTGYRKRFTADLAGSTVKNTAAALASFALDEDPRFPPPGTDTLEGGGFLERVRRGVIGPFVQWRPDGWRPRFALAIAAVCSGFAGNIYYPASQRNWSAVALRGGGAIGGYEVSSVFNEFEPSLVHLVGRIFGNDESNQPAPTKEGSR